MGRQGSARRVRELWYQSEADGVLRPCARPHRQHLTVSLSLVKKADQRAQAHQASLGLSDYVASCMLRTHDLQASAHAHVLAFYVLAAGRISVICLVETFIMAVL